MVLSSVNEEPVGRQFDWLRDLNLWASPKRHGIINKSEFPKSELALLCWTHCLRASQSEDCTSHGNTIGLCLVWPHERKVSYPPLFGCWLDVCYVGRLVELLETRLTCVHPKFRIMFIRWPHSAASSLICTWGRTSYTGMAPTYSYVEVECSEKLSD